MNQILAPAFEVSPKVLSLAAKVKLLLFDVDGVLTDGRLVIGDDGLEFKAFNSRDGHGIKMLQRHGISVGIITGRTSDVVKHRVKDLQIKHVYQGCKEKLPVYQKLIKKLKLKPEQTAYVGDDVVDLPIMLQVGLAVAVQNAHSLTKQYAHWVTPSIGGYGAAREVCDMLLHAHGLYHTEMQRYLSGKEPPS
ncbi:MAG: 3-deoxy-manno-octulosonate-8-phosphatase KdsC [Sulfuricaulis sp.]|nr:3-deoxy-manno-octulosonate-8-phosphatase KdsC [Sulfuricaulis sp.]